MEFAPDKGICISLMVNLHPPASAMTLPKSPACLVASVGAPCVILFGLKCGPVDMHPLVVSPNSWTCKPCLPGAKPVMSPTTVVAPDGSSCVKVNVPATPAVPVRTTTAFCLFVSDNI